MVRYIILAFLMIASFILMFISERPFLFSAILWVLLVALSYFDLKYFRLPNLITAALLISGIIYNIYIKQNIWVPVSSAFIALLFFSTIAVAYYKLRGVHGLGMGDIKLITAGAIWLVPAQLPLVIFLASLSAIIYYLVSPEVSDNSASMKVPFGPFLSIAIMCVWLFGEQFLYLFM